VASNPPSWVASRPPMLLLGRVRCPREGDPGACLGHRRPSSRTPMPIDKHPTAHLSLVPAGMMVSHYSTVEPECGSAASASRPAMRCSLLHFRCPRARCCATAVMNLSSRGDLHEPRRIFFGYLRALTPIMPRRIAVMQIPTNDWAKPSTDRGCAARRPKGISRE